MGTDEVAIQIQVSKLNIEKDFIFPDHSLSESSCKSLLRGMNIVINNRYVSANIY